VLEYEMEEIEVIKDERIEKVILPRLTEEEKGIIDPIVAPTSGLRIQILDEDNQNHGVKYKLTKKKLYLYLRVLKAISIKYKQLKNNKQLKVLIVTDDRPTRHVLLKYSSQIFAQDGFEVYFQSDDDNESRISSPYGAASVRLLEDISLIIVLTASHNDLTWNGIKFYIDYPIPISGDLFKEISSIALDLNEIELKTDFIISRIDAEKKNNKYVKDLLTGVLEIESIRGENIVIWPYLGKARGIVNLFKSYGANVILIDEEINPPNPIKVVKEDKLQKVMRENNSNLALLLDADRDRIALYVYEKQKDEFSYYIPNEIYSAMHNILAKEYQKRIINVRTIPSDLRADKSSFINILTGVGYKHIGIILYFLLDIEVEKSKVASAILYLEAENGELIKIDNPKTLKEEITKYLDRDGITHSKFIIVMWEESGGHTLNVISIEKDKEQGYKFKAEFPLIADKYPVPALVIATELISRGHIISESIDWSIKGINRTIPANDEEKVKIMKNFEENDGKTIQIEDKRYQIHALSDNSGDVDIYQLKSGDSTLYFRPSGTGPEVRFYIFGKRETHLDEIKAVQQYVKSNYS
jgi:phosphomannomutase